jgi:hypothetical protein
MSRSVWLLEWLVCKPILLILELGAAFQALIIRLIHGRERPMLWRHGDVLIATVDRIPLTATPQHHLILAKGEVTGHSHRIAEADTAHLFELNGTLYLDVVAAFATVIHEEHHTITLPQGRYKVWIQREYTPAAIVRVRD